MAQVEINDPNGFETVYSPDFNSPAAPYIQEYHPQSFEDLYEIGVIPKHVRLKHLRTARDTALAASHPYIDLSIVEGHPETDQPRQIEARSRSLVVDSTANAMTRTLVARYGYDPAEAMLLSRKVLAFESKLFEKLPAFVTVNLYAFPDFLIKTPLVIDRGIHALMARNVVIYKGGKVRLEGSYFLLKCDSFKGEQLWFDKFPLSAPSSLPGPSGLLGRSKT
jgi:hypothetical protein